MLLITWSWSDAIWLATVSALVLHGAPKNPFYLNGMRLSKTNSSCLVIGLRQRLNFCTVKFKDG